MLSFILMKPQDLIRRKRDGKELSEREVEKFIAGVCNDSWTDAQVSAMLMAMFIHGLSQRELDALVKAMLYSGEVLDLSDIDKPKADKHSTGGVGDKTSLIVAPLVASYDVAVPMISGRALGHTGGTLDKLESIKGYKVELSTSQIKHIVKSCGFAFAGQTESLVPADRRLYALRDATSTIESLPLIVASIMSKKLAEGLDVLMLDVKTGNGAFMRSFDDAYRLAEAMVKTGDSFGVVTEALITDMNQPLGRFVGNKLEVYECICIMRGEIDEIMKPTADLSMELAARMLVNAGKFDSLVSAFMACKQKLSEGKVLEKFRENLILQGGDPNVCDDPVKFVSDENLVKLPVKSKREGFVVEIRTKDIGETVALIGAGRTKHSYSIDHSIGLECLKKIGDQVKEGEELCVLYCRSESQAVEASEKILKAYRIEDKPVVRPHLIHGYVF